MFLTFTLLRKGIPGQQWIGKYRRPRQVTWQMKRNMVKHLEREAENEYWISRPYMTPEQEYCHAVERRAQTWLKIKESKLSNFPEHNVEKGISLAAANLSRKQTAPGSQTERPSARLGADDGDVEEKWSTESPGPASAFLLRQTQFV